MKKIIPVALLLAMLIWLFYPKQEIEETIKVQTPVLIKEQEDATSLEKKKAELDELIRASNERVKLRLEKEELDQNTNEPDLDLITAFRDYKYFETCEYIFEIYKNNIELAPVDQFNQSYNVNHKKLLEPTSQQLSYLQSHADKCNSYFDSQSKNFQSELSSLRRRYERINPKSSKEKSLRQAIDLHSLSNRIKGQLEQAKGGAQKDLKLHFDYLGEIKSLRKKIQKIRASSQSNFSFNLTISDEEKNIEIIKLLEQMENLEKLVKENFYIDHELIGKLDKEKQDLFKKIKGFLNNNNSPDAFLLLTEILIPDKIIVDKEDVEYEFINQIKTKFKFNDSDYFDLLNEIVYPLIACYLDYPCDDMSRHVVSICLNYRNPDSALACGKNLEDFYLNNYLSPNQTIDFNNYFNYLLDVYVKQ